MPSANRYPRGGDSWLLYIVECRDGSLYTGITNDLDRRLKQHNDGEAARYTRGRRPVALRYREPCADRAAALAREMAVKLLSRREKEALIAGAPQPTRA
jgi:putative endonuclease